MICCEQVLSVDYDIVSDLFLRTLENASDLKRLVVHVNGAAGNHPGTTNDAWSDFRAIHPACELRLTLVHAYQEVYILDEILKKNMPLSHLKVFFCEYVSYSCLYTHKCMLGCIKTVLLFFCFPN